MKKEKEIEKKVFKRKMKPDTGKPVSYVNSWHPYRPGRPRRER